MFLTLISVNSQIHLRKNMFLVRFHLICLKLILSDREKNYASFKSKPRQTGLELTENDFPHNFLLIITKW